MKLKKDTKNRRLLVTMTNEPFQPVRLYYSIPDRSFVRRRLQSLKCMTEVRSERCWEWLFQAEAALLRFPGGYGDVPIEKRPVVLGRIRFPNDEEMTLETNSIPRAIEGARFLGPRFGPEVAAIRCRVVNRWFAADEGNLNALMNTLDKNVVVIDPRVAEAAFLRDFGGARTEQDIHSAGEKVMERKLKNGEDVPMVEDLPLAPEEETPDFRTLEITLQLRGIHALEHWNGNTHLTLAAIIQGLMKQSARAQNK